MKNSFFILAHKPVKYNCNIDNRYKILQCGSALSNKKFGDILDNTGNNISYKNKYWVETTGIYWIWKNCKSDIKGHTQYRRFLSVNLDLVSNILEKYDIILASPVTWNCSLEQQYLFTHNINDLCDCEKIIKEKYKNYSISYDITIKRNKWLYYSNSFIAKQNIYDNLCEFCFSVLEDFEKMHNFSCYENVYEHEHMFCTNHKFHRQIIEDFKKGHPETNDMVYIQSMVFGYLFEKLSLLKVLELFILFIIFISCLFFILVSFLFSLILLNKFVGVIF